MKITVLLMDGTTGLYESQDGYSEAFGTIVTILVTGVLKDVL